MRRVFFIFEVFGLALCPKLHIDDKTGVVDTLLLLARLLSKAVMLRCLMADNFVELLIVLLQPGLFLIAQQLL